MLYLDHAATTPVRPEAREAMAPFLDAEFGNASGIHGVSRRAKNALEDARERVAAILGVGHPLDVVFTGGGTESDNLGVAGPALASGARGGVVTTAIEHEAVLETARFLERLGCPVAVVGVGSDGRVDPGEMAVACGPGTRVVSVMAANNETGVIQPVPEIADAVREAAPDAVVHTDAVQAFVSREVSLDSLGVDLITVASHKVGGPKGVGALAMRSGIDLEPVIHGGGQELGRRSGTHDVAGIVGMAAALEAAVKDRDRLIHDVGEARNRFETRLLSDIRGAALTAPGVDRLVQHSHFRIDGVDADTLLIRLDRGGVAASAGSACQSGAMEVSHVLAAMGVDEAAARSSIRFSFGWTTRSEDGDAAADAVMAAVAGLR
ncbi:MAG TPA: cysteine desulfurase family protein [Acidimicrobiia bacterium]|nr:cysteine desulfurase family protein [Acidimicrobiia bacterium]